MKKRFGTMFTMLTLLLQPLVLLMVSGAHGQKVESEPSLPKVIIISPADDNALQLLKDGFIEGNISVLHLDLEGGCDEQTAATLAQKHQARAVVWHMDSETKRHLFCYLNNDSGPTLKLRVFDTTDPSSLILVQKAIGRGWAEAIHRKNSPKPSEPPLHPKRPRPPLIATDPPQNKAKPHWLNWGVGYTLCVQSKQHPANHGVAMALEGRLGPRFGLFLSYLFGFPVVDRRDDLTMTLRSHPVWLGFRFTSPVGPVELTVQAALDVDYVSKIVDTDNTLASRGDRGGVSIALVPMISLSVKIGGPFRFFVSMGGDIYIRRPVYSVPVDGESIVFHKEWAAQPRVISGFSFDFFQKRRSK